MSKTKLRPAQPHDATRVAELFAHIKEKKREEVQDLIAQKRVYVLKRNKKIIAAFSYSIFGIIGFFAIMYIHRIAVLPELHGQGIGSLLLAKIKSQSVKTGSTAILLYSLERVRVFYEKNKLNSVWRFFWWSNQT